MVAAPFVSTSFGGSAWHSGPRHWWSCPCRLWAGGPVRRQDPVRRAEGAERAAAAPRGGGPRHCPCAGQGRVRVRSCDEVLSALADPGLTTPNISPSPPNDPT